MGALRSAWARQGGLDRRRLAVHLRRNGVPARVLRQHLVADGRKRRTTQATLRGELQYFGVGAAHRLDPNRAHPRRVELALVTAREIARGPLVSDEDPVVAV